MRPRTVVAIVVIVALLGGATVLGLNLQATSGGSLSEAWTSDTATDIQGNHHTPAIGTIDGDPMVFAPVSGKSGTQQCRLAGLNATDGATEWRYDVAPENCEVHSVADPTLADFDGDGETEVLAATTEKTVTAHDPQTGDVEFRHELSSYGYTKPVVTDLDEDGTVEIVVVDAKGTVVVVGADGVEHWRDRLDSYTWGQPAVEDFDADGQTEIAVAAGSGTVRLYGPDGDVEWKRTNATESLLSWMTTTPSSAGGRNIVIATTGGTVKSLDGTDGSVNWKRTFGSMAAVQAVGDGDRDGESEVYAVAADGVLRSLDATTGDVEWKTTLTTETVQMMPPPNMADLDGDGHEELLAVSNAGGVTVVGPETGEVLASASRSVPIYAHPAVGDVDGDGAAEAYVTYADGRVVSYVYTGA